MHFCSKVCHFGFTSLPLQHVNTPCGSGRSREQPHPSHNPPSRHPQPIQIGFVKSLARQFGPKGIRVNGVAPGPIYTPLQVSGGATEQHWRDFGGDYPLARAGQPAELASIYVQLAAEDASYTTGNIYGAGGGKGQP